MPRRRGTEKRQISAPWWDSNEVVLIRSFLAQDEDVIQDKLAQVVDLTDAQKKSGKKEEAKMQLNLGTVRHLTLMQGIEEWTLVDDRGRRLELNEQNVRELANEDAQYIYDEINDLNKPMSERQKKDSTIASGNGTQLTVIDSTILMQSQS